MSSFSKIRSYVNKSSLKLILHSLFISHIRYGLLCYARAKKSHLKKTNILFNRALRCINFYSRQEKSTSLLYYDENILKLEDMFKLELAKFCFKYKNNLLPKSFNHFYTATNSIHNHNTRKSSNNLFVTRQNTSKDFLASLGSKLWNQIPMQIRSLDSLQIFSINLKEHFLPIDARGRFQSTGSIAKQQQV